GTTSSGPAVALKLRRTRQGTSAPTRYAAIISRRVCTNNAIITEAPRPASALSPRSRTAPHRRSQPTLATVAAPPPAAQPADHEANGERRRDPPNELCCEGVHLLLPSAPAPAVTLSPAITARYCGRTVNSMRRFFAMFSSLSLGTIGRAAPNPMGSSWPG